VYALVRQIPLGCVATYGQIARVVGCTPRMVGFAMAASPKGVPWQRVINFQGRISLPVEGGAAARQKALLESEGINFGASDRVDLQKFGWLPQ
jgi:methylated-DNA-protein-cysteine methyltransferase-like protein